MKKHLLFLVISIACLLGGCSKESLNTGNPVADEATARIAFSKINGLWLLDLKPRLSGVNQTFSGKVLQDSAGGKAIVNGSYSSKNASSSSSSSSSSTTDVVITFQQYEYAGVRLEGTLRFYNFNSSRTACSSSGCASSSHGSQSYSSTKGTGANLTPLTIGFSANGKTYKDAITLSADKSLAHWAIEVTNGNNQTFSFSY